MFDIGSGTLQRDVDKFILEALKEWEECGFKDMSLWETFQGNFDGFTEEDFRLAGNNNQQRLWDYLRKFGVWIRRQQRYPIARSLHDALLEEEPIPWTEAEIIACEEKEEFASYHINRLLDSDFGRKPRRSRILTPSSPTGPPSAATSPTPAPSAPAPFASPTPTPAVYGAPASHTSGTGPTPGAYMQPPGTRPLPSATYTQPSGIGPTPGVYATAGSHTQQSSTGPAHAVQNPKSAVDTPSVTSTGYTPTFSLEPPAATTSSVSVPFTASSASPIPPSKAPVSIPLASTTPASVYASTISPSTRYLPRRRAQDPYLH